MYVLQYKGSFNNYVDQILPNFDPFSSRQLWTFHMTLTLCHVDSLSPPPSDFQNLRRLCLFSNLNYFSISITRFIKNSRSMTKATQNSLQPKQGPRPTMILGRISINPKIISIPHQMILVRISFFNS